MDRGKAAIANVQLPRVLSQRGKTSLEVERENFERSQSTSALKAINKDEVPAKEKHVRILILGTHKESGCALFWSNVSKLPLQGHPIVAWKFCHVLHRLLRDGHENLCKDSQRAIRMLTDLGKLWGHLKEGYGRLIAHYVKLIVQKLQFHQKNPEFPGNLNLNEEEGEDKLDKITANDVNSYFELCVDMLDYMDDILALQAAVFGSLDMSRSNSMTASGQCRLAPLIMCIQDSCQLYDFIVRILFKMHASLPPDTLGGHRQRFHDQYKKLKKFYYSSANLQYFKHLIQVPSLPGDPPNFLKLADLSRHEAPVAVVTDTEPSLQTPDDVTEDMLLIDTSTDDLLSNGSPPAAPPPPPPRQDERDALIQQLQREVTGLRHQLHHQHAEHQMMTESLNNRCKELEMELSEMRNIAESTQQENEILKTSMQDGEKNMEAAARLQAMEKVAKSNEEKFKKMKDIYGKLREEHVSLIRKEADGKKQLHAERIKQEEFKQAKLDLEQQVSMLQQDKERAECSLVQSSESVSAQLVEAEASKERLLADKQEMEKQIEEMEATKSELQKSVETEKAAQDTMQLKIKELEQEVEGLREEKKKAETCLEETATSSSSQLAEAEAAKTQLEQDKAAMAAEVSRLEGTQQELESVVSQCRADMESLRAQLEQSGAERVSEATAAQQQRTQLNHDMLGAAISEGRRIITEAMEQQDNPHLASTTCTAEYLLDRATPVIASLKELRTACTEYEEKDEAICRVIRCLCDFSHRVGDTIVLGYATAQAAPIDQGEALSGECKNAGEQSLALLNLLHKSPADSDPTDPGARNAQYDRVTALIERIMAHAEELVPKIEDVAAEQMGDLIDKEMQETQNAIEAAAKKIDAMLAASRAAQSGVQLEVNERILDSCNALMLAIKVLIQRSKTLQREIADSSRGAASQKEFYKKHHRWTEGLISAAKAVGWGANVLVEAADKVVKGEGKFEELVVCSQEIAASTTQLVVSSKVKVDKNSLNLKSLGDASKGVTEATATVMASAKQAAQMIEDMDTMDFSHMTLHQAKRQEMESQVRVLELESDLEKERRKLGELRKTHYQLAGESEGWEQEDIDSQA